MKLGYFIILLSLVWAVYIVGQPVNAQMETYTNTPNTTKNTATGAGSEERQAQRLANAKTRAGKEIERRITALNRLLTRITSMKKLTPDQIATFTSQIQTEITNLTNLKAKIEADSDLKTLQEDIKSIVTSYRIYALFIPKLSLIAAADRIGAITDKLGSISDKLQTEIQQVQSLGKDVSSIQDAFDDLQAKIADAKVQYNAVIAEVTPLAPEGYPGNKSVLTDAKSKLKTGTDDLKAAQQDVKTIILGLKTLKKSSDTAMPKITSSATTPAVLTTQQPQL